MKLLRYLTFYCIIRRYLGYSNLEIVSRRYLKNGTGSNWNRDTILLVNLPDERSLVHDIGLRVIRYEVCGRINDI